MKRLYILFFFLVSFGLLQAQNKSPQYSFFAAGHTYGNPNSFHEGLHYPFVDYFPQINAYSNMDLGFLTGDVVVSSTAVYWDAAEADMSKLNMPLYIAAGNHDIGAEFVSRFENYYFSFTHKNDLFIVLAPGLSSWNITGDQLEFLISTLDSNYSEVKHIFIFMHQLIWWSPDNQYQHIKINYAPQYPGITNFESEIIPLLKSYPKQFTIYAGDLGATNQVSPFMYHSFDNITLIGSGMGGGVRDNIIITDVYEDTVYHHLVALNGEDPNALGKLTDFSISSIDDSGSSEKFLIYPNPFKDSFTLTNKHTNDFKLSVYDASGLLVHKEEIKKYSTMNIALSASTPGFYLLVLEGENETYKREVLLQ